MTLQKKHLVGLLTLGAVGVWVPALANLPQPTARHTGAEDGGDPDERPTQRAGFLAGLGAASAPPAAEPAEPEHAADAGVDSVLQALRNFRSQPAVLPLDRMASSWAPGERVADAVPSAPSASAAPSAASVDEAEVQRFLDAHPLAAVLQARERSLALLGPRVVREGEALLGDALVVQRIEERRVVLLRGGRPLVLELPPIQNRPAPGLRDDEREPEAETARSGGS